MTHGGRTKKKKRGGGDSQHVRKGREKEDGAWDRMFGMIHRQGHVATLLIDSHSTVILASASSTRHRVSTLSDM